MGMPEATLIVAALALAGGLLRFANPPTPVRIDARGIFDRRLGLGCISWDEIEGAWQPRDGSGRRIQLRLRVSKRLSRLLKRRSPDPVPAIVEVPVDLSGTQISGIEVIQEVLAHALPADSAHS